MVSCCGTIAFVTAPGGLVVAIVASVVTVVVFVLLAQHTLMLLL